MSADHKAAFDTTTRVLFDDISRCHQPRCNASALVWAGMLPCRHMKNVTSCRNLHPSPTNVIRIQCDYIKEDTRYPSIVQTASVGAARPVSLTYRILLSKLFLGQPPCGNSRINFHNLYIKQRFFGQCLSGSVSLQIILPVKSPHNPHLPLPLAFIPNLHTPKNFER